MDSQNEYKRLREEFLTEAKQRLQALNKAMEAGDEPLPTNLSVVDLTVRLMQAQGLNDDASAFVAEWVSGQDQENQEKKAKVQLYLKAGKLYSDLGQHEEAEQWYLRLMEIVPRAYVMVVQARLDQGNIEEAADFCLRASAGDPGPEEAILLTRILMSDPQATASLSEAKSTIENVVARNPDNLKLLQAVAVMNATLGEYDKAIASFRHLVEIDPQNTSARNNLATLLAERPDQRGEALEHIERALAIAGRVPPLLDTQGTIYLKMGKDSQAIQCLEEATASGATDARYYFHLAAAYERAKRPKEAADALQIARDYGLENTILTNDDRTLLAHLDQQLATKSLSTTGTKR